MKYINAEKLIAEIAKRKYEVFPTGDGKVRVCSTPDQIQSGWLNALKCVRETITSLQQEPRFPQYDNIVEKIFGAGNLEWWEFRDAEMLVALAKEELLKSLQQEQPEVDLEKELDNWRHEHFKGKRDGDYSGEYLERESQLDLARHVYQPGLKVRKE